MKHRQQQFAKAYGAAWAILLAGFVAIGGRYVWILPSEAGLVRNTPFASSDAYLHAFFHAPNASRPCLELMRGFYGKGAVVVFSPPRSGLGDLGFFLVSYLSWPEQLRKVEVDRAALDEAVRSLDRSSTVAVIFCNLPPPSSFAHVWRIGPWLSIAELDQSK